MHLKKFSYDELTHLHLSVLREIGREIGVRAPTAESKKSLTNLIIKIQDGDMEPTPVSKRGAPPKIAIDLSQYYVPDEDDTETKAEKREKPKSEAKPEKKSDEKPEIDMSDCKPIPETTPYKGGGAPAKLSFNDVAVDGFYMEGVLDMPTANYGFLRASNKKNSADDVYVSLPKIKHYNLRKGDRVRAYAKHVGDGESASLQEVLLINGYEPAFYRDRKSFDELVPYYPTQRIDLERDDKEDDLSIRCIDLFSPIGFGQRGLIVAPPKTGKTTLLKKIAKSIEKNHPETELIILLIDERPEEVTDFQRSVSSEVVYSTFDESAEHHIRVAEAVLNRAKRIVEIGKDVVVLLDSITKLTRAYNATVEPSGRTLSGGLDPTALGAPKKFFGAARNIENGGSFTIISTALIETGSRMDDVIFEEFKGTGNMEIHLSRSLSEKRVFPAIDLYKSGTRKEELLLSEKELDIVVKIRRMLAERQDASESLLEMLKKTQSNADFVAKAEQWIKLYNK